MTSLCPWWLRTVISVDHAAKKIKMCQHRNRAVARMALKKDPPGFRVEMDLVYDVAMSSRAAGSGRHERIRDSKSPMGYCRLLQVGRDTSSALILSSGWHVRMLDSPRASNCVSCPALSDCEGPHASAAYVECLIGKCNGFIAHQCLNSSSVDKKNGKIRW